MTAAAFPQCDVDREARETVKDAVVCLMELLCGEFLSPRIKRASDLIDAGRFDDASLAELLAAIVPALTEGEIVQVLRGFDAELWADVEVLMGGKVARYYRRGGEAMQ